MNTSHLKQYDDRIRYVVAAFDNVEHFEDAVELLEQRGFLRAQIGMIAGRDTVRDKLSRHFRPAGDPHAGGRLPQIMFAERHDIVEGPALAIGTPVYVGCTAAGQPVVATGGALAFATVIAAAGRPDEAAAGDVFAQIVDPAAAARLENLIAEGWLLLGVDVIDAQDEDYAAYLLDQMGGCDVAIHEIAYRWPSKHQGLDHFDPYALGDADRASSPWLSAIH